MRKHSPNPIPRLKAKVWKVFSEYVRRSAADRNGMVICFACGAIKHWKEMNASHLFHGKLDSDPLNVQPCCVGCNKYKHGNLGAYTANFIKKYGIDVYDELKRRSNIIWKPTREELENLYEFWTAKLEELGK